MFDYSSLAERAEGLTCPKVGLYSPFMPAAPISHRIFFADGTTSTDMTHSNHPAMRALNEGWLRAARSVLLLLIVAQCVLGGLQSLITLQEPLTEIACSKEKTGIRGFLATTSTRGTSRSHRDGQLLQIAEARLRNSNCKFGGHGSRLNCHRRAEHVRKKEKTSE
jgi:hypothetical protein